VFFNTLRLHSVAARSDAQFGHVGDRDATVFRHYERLSFCGEAGHVVDDGFFLTAIKTQGLLLLVCIGGPGQPPDRPIARHTAATNCFQETNPFSSGIAICVGFG
jgi:hypothetical protein